MSSTPPRSDHQTEKPSHYTYLKEFRVNQCPLFLQHKCTQHRPFTCFYWHFSNQRRRRPVRKRDGTFNYSADSYCTKYDETTGICPIGEDCPFIHRNTGDTERRYHLRYYKTGTCIHETDSRGNCVKNGPHCAFAHGSEDLRPPVYDSRCEGDGNGPEGSGDHMPRSDVVNLAEKIVNEDTKWLEAHYVLSNYKTDVCKRPPRLCRQGYACPQYHNPKDRRRNPKKFKYRSTPCPNVKQGDDWKDPSCCEKGDGCAFCHTRTEQQFHPEIYKSTKCHDMSQTGYCPRGPFCAFAHVEQEIRVVDEAADNGVVVQNNNNVAGDSLMLEHDVVQNNLRAEVEAKKAAMSLMDVNNDMTEQMWAPPLTSASLMGDLYEMHQQQQDGMMSRSFPSNKHSPAKPRFNNNSNDFGFSKAVGSAVVGNNQPTNSMLASSWSRGQAAVNGIDSPFGVPPVTKPMSYGGENSFFGTAAAKQVDALVDGGKDLSRIWNNNPEVSAADSLFPKSSPLTIPPYGHHLDQHHRYPGAGSLPSDVPPMFDTITGMNSNMAASSFPLKQNNSQQPQHQQQQQQGVVSIVEFERVQRKCKQWEEAWNQAKVACDAWQKESKEASVRAEMFERRVSELMEMCERKDRKIKMLESGVMGEKSVGGVVVDPPPSEFGSVEDLRNLHAKYKTYAEMLEKRMWSNLWTE